MKKFLLGLLLAFPIFIIAQDDLSEYQFDVDNNNVENYTKIVQFEAPSSVLFSKFQSWITATFQSYQDVVTFEDKENLKITLNASINNPLTAKSGGGIMVEKELQSFSLNIEFREGRYRYVFSDFEYLRLASVLGKPSKERINRNYHLERIKSFQNKLDNARQELQNYEEIGLSLKGKKKSKNDENISELKKSIRSFESMISNHITFYINEYTLVENLATSLEDYLDGGTINDDW